MINSLEMEPLSKLSLNNQIVIMRHIVCKSKVHIINKLSRESKKLKAKKGTEKQIAKNKKKAERFVNELLVIKKLNNDVVSKYALQNEVPSVVILNSVDASMETKALARLAGHALIMDSVISFRNKYPDWKLCITDLLSVLGTNYRGKKKPNENKTIKDKTKILKNKNRIITDMKDIEDPLLSESEDIKDPFSKSENIKDPLSESEDFKDPLSESEDNIESVNYKTDLNTSNVTLEETEVEKISPLENTTIEEEDKNEELESVIISKEINRSLGKCDNIVKYSQEVNVLEKQLPKTKNSSTNKCINDFEVKFDKTPLKRKAEHNLSSKVDYKMKRTIVEEIKPICETVDSFFMTADNKDYMSVYKPPPPTVERNLTERPKIDNQKSTKEIFIKGKKLNFGKQSNLGNRRERRQQVEEPQDTMLHPSWEAKRKQKSLAKFEGKKITFDDQD